VHTGAPSPSLEQAKARVLGIHRLGIPTVTDRVVQAALKRVLEPIWEADFQPCSYGFRPRRRAQDAIAEIHLHGEIGLAPPAEYKDTYYRHTPTVILLPSHPPRRPSERQFGASTEPGAGQHLLRDWPWEPSCAQLFDATCGPPAAA
jgi:hypothetical protein